MYRVDLVRVDTTGHDMCVAGTSILEKEKKCTSSFNTDSSSASGYLPLVKATKGAGGLCTSSFDTNSSFASG